MNSPNKEAPGTREQLAVVHPDDLSSAEAQDGFANAIADYVIAIVEDDRKSRGLPPLKD